jgi:dipeptidyl aminopeptidase/acylaminoacyl peptidase
MEERALRFARRLGLLVCFLVAAGPESSATESLSGQRGMRFAAKTPDEALAWQKAARGKLAQLLKLEELLQGAEAGLAGRSIPSLNEKVLATREEEKYSRYDIEVNSTKTRRTRVVLTVPRPLDAKAPAVVCIHGHGGQRNIVYEEKSPYRGFARVLAENGFVTISTDVGQHEVFEEGRMLMGERLWDVMRCVDYLLTRKEVDRERIGCAGLSLGGEMAMWLGAMDTRIKVSVSSGFLTTVENLRQGHCPCWDFPGFTQIPQQLL